MALYMSNCFKDNRDFSIETRKWKIEIKTLTKRFDKLIEEVKEKDKRAVQKIEDSEATL